MRDELLKVTSTHLAAIDDYEAKLSDAKAQASTQQEDATRTAQALNDKIAVMQGEADILKHDLDTTRKQVCAI